MLTVRDDLDTKFVLKKLTVYCQKHTCNHVNYDIRDVIEEEQNAEGTLRKVNIGADQSEQLSWRMIISEISLYSEAHYSW